MKKLIAIPLLVLYLVAVSGTMVQFHFCGEKLSSFNINLPEASCCCGAIKAAPVQGNKAVLSDKDDCCSDKTITLKITQEQNTVYAKYLELESLQLALPPEYAAPGYFTLPPAAPVIAYRANAPPGLWQGIPLYKLHSRFTYYG